MKKTFVLLMVVIVSTALFSVLPGYALTFSDDFSGGSIDSFWWNTSASEGNTIEQKDGKIVMIQNQCLGESGMVFNFEISGDFVMQVDYTLLDWPDDNLECTGLVASEIGTLERSQNTGWYGDAYLTNFYVVEGPGQVVWTPTTDMSGTLRMVRADTTVTGSYWNGSDWTEIHSFTNPAVADDTFVYFHIWNGYEAAKLPVEIAFDNFFINAPATNNPVPAPATILLLSSGLLGLAGVRRRFRKG